MNLSYSVDRIANAQTELLRAQLQNISQVRASRLADDGQARQQVSLSQDMIATHLKE